MKKIITTSHHAFPGRRFKKYAHHRLAGLLIFVCLLSFTAVRAQLLVPFAGSNSLACGTNTVLQDHSGYTQYANNALGHTVLHAGFASAISINGPYNTESNFDYVRIYDGVGTGGTLLLNVSGSGNINYTGNAGQTLTVEFDSDGSVLGQGFSLTVTYNGPCFATPCAGTPPGNAVVSPTYELCASNSTAQLALATSYSLNGLTYSWQSSTTSSVGLWTTVPNATNTAYLTPNHSVTTWYQVVVTCTNGGASSTVTIPGAVMIASNVVTNTVPYKEDFELIGKNDRLPNCSWDASGQLVTTRTFTQSGTGNRIPYSGTSFAYFSNTPGTHYYYSNGIWMEPGITYSASMWFTTDLTGAANWSNLAILTGTAQTPTGLNPVAVINGAVISPVYKRLSNTFTVATAAYHYVAIRATAAAGTAQYLSWDDLEITIPCEVSPNTPTLTLSASSTTICKGAQVSLTASGADVYSWSNGATGAFISDAPDFNTNYMVTGTNSLSGCSAVASVFVKVNPSPVLSLLALPGSVCLGKPLTLMASGAYAYSWFNGASGSVITVTPSANSTYSVIGTGTNNCSSLESISVNVLPLPNITANGSSPAICQGEPFYLSANGGVSYTWISDNAPEILNGSPVNVMPNISGTYTVTGTGANGCQNKAMVAVAVDPCLGLNDQNTVTGQVRVYPNPSGGLFQVESAGTDLQIRVSDISGRIVLQQSALTGKATIDIRHVAAGIYYVTLSSDQGSETLKVIKQ